MKANAAAVAMSFCLGLAAQAGPLVQDSTQILGLTYSGEPAAAPQRICVAPGRTLRLKADVWGKITPSYTGRKGLPSYQILFQLVAQDGRFEIWRGGMAATYVFANGPEQDSVYVTLPLDMGPMIRLEAQGPTPATRASLILVNGPHGASINGCINPFPGVLM